MGKNRKNKRHKMHVKKKTRTKGSSMNFIKKLKETVVDLVEPTPYVKRDFRCANEAIIYKSELEYIKKCILEYPHIETGGQLFGFWTPQGRPVVLYAIGPGPRAGHHNTFFEQDIDYLNLVGNAIVKTFGLCHIGEWHSHHQLGLAQPSGYDASNIQNNVDRFKLNHFLLCIGNCIDRETTLNPFMFYQGARQYIKVSWKEIYVDSPFRSIIDSALKNVLVHPKSHTTNTSNEVSITQTSSQKSKIYNDGYWLNDKENGFILKNIVDYVKDCNRGYHIEVKLDNITKYVHIQIISSGIVEQDIFFDNNFPNCPPHINPAKTEEVYNPSDWNFDGNILSAFKNYYKNIQ